MICLRTLRDVGVGEGAVGGLEAQAVGQAAPALGQAGAAEDVEQVDAPQQLAACGSDRVLDRGCGDVVVDLEGEVDVRARVEAEGAVAARSPCGRSSSVSRSTSRIGHPLADAVGVEHAGIDLAEVPQHSTSPTCQPGGPGGVQARHRRVDHLHALDPERLGHGSHRCTAAVASAPAMHRAEHLSLVGQLRRRVGGTAEHVTDLQQAHAVVAVRPVVGDRADEPWQQRGPQHGLLGHQRVGDRDAVVREPAAAQLAGRQEGQRHRLRQARVP